MLAGFLIMMILFFLFVIHALGAGDIKLLMVIAAFYGFTYTLKITAFAFVVGGVMSLVKMLRQRELIERMGRLIHWAVSQVRSRTLFPYGKQEDICEQDTIHFTWAILCGYFLALL
jgi:prepilin peptidase CpaA